MGTGRGSRSAALVRFAVLLAAAGFDVLTVDTIWPAALFIAVAAAAVVVTARRRAAPLPVLLVVLLSVAVTAVLAGVRPAGLGSFGMVELAALLLLLESLVRRDAAPLGGWAAAAVVVALLALPLRALSMDTPSFVLGVGTAAAIAVAVGTSLRSDDAAGRRAVAAVQQAEREAIARELHDVVAHHVTGIVVAAQAARFTAGTTPQMAEIEEAGERALEAMRGLVGVLRTDPAAGAPRAPVATLAALPELVERFRRTEPAMRVEAVLTPDAPAPMDVPDEVQAGVYRIVQEGLTNIRRHAAGARSARVTVRQQSGGLLVEVFDSGSPQAGTGGGGYGLVGMRERAAALGGTCTAGPHGSGWLVRALLPVALP